MKRSLVVGGLLTVALCLAQAAVWAQDEKKDDKPLTDAEFVQKASAGSLAEIEFGKLAPDRAANENVKTYAKRMVEDHTNWNKKLSVIAAKKNIPMARELEKECREQCDKLRELRGAEFDKTYIQGEVKGHEMAIKCVEGYIKSSQDEELKTFAQEALPTLKEHLKQAKELAEKAGG